jgi:hypothetical protein
MNLAILLAGGAFVLVALVVMAGQLRTRRHRPLLDGGPPGGDDRIPSPPIPKAGDGTAVAADFYAPSFIVDPGHCFRLCRDPATDTAHPCDGRVEGRGVFVDHRGNRVEVEACGVHMIDLDSWQFDPVDG